MLLLPLMILVVVVVAAAALVSSAFNHRSSGVVSSVLEGRADFLCCPGRFLAIPMHQEYSNY